MFLAEFCNIDAEVRARNATLPSGLALEEPMKLLSASELTGCTGNSEVDHGVMQTTHPNGGGRVTGRVAIPDEFRSANTIPLDRYLCCYSLVNLHPSAASEFNGRVNRCNGSLPNRSSFPLLHRKYVYFHGNPLKYGFSMGSFQNDTFKRVLDFETLFSYLICCRRRGAIAKFQSSAIL